MFKKKVKKQVPRVEFPDAENEEVYEPEQTVEPGEEYEEGIEEPDESDLPAMPVPRRKTARPVQQRSQVKEPEDQESASQYSVSEHLDMIEGNLNRAYLALVEFRKLAKK